MRETRPIPDGVLFGLSVTFSWTLASALLALAFWHGPRTPGDLARWAGLWFFTVVAPTMEAYRVNRRLGDLLHSCPDVGDRARRELLRTRFALLMFGGITAIVAFSLAAAR